MSIINLQRNHVGVQSTLTQFGDYLAAGQGTMFRHTDGYIYCIFAQNYLSGVANERRLYITRSNDNGLTWSDRITITSGHFDDKPAAIQLTSSNDIGLIFMRTDADYHGNNIINTMIRAQINTAGILTEAAFDEVTNSSAIDAGWLSLIAIDNGYLIAALDRTSISSPQIRISTNDNFTQNDWSEFASHDIFPTNEQPMSMSLKRLNNKHLALVGVYRTSLNGATTTYITQNLPAAMIRCDVGISFSDDEGQTWTAIQKLSNYTGTLTLDLLGIDSAASADLEQLSDDTIVVAYQEHTTPQFISHYTSGGTTLAFPNANVGQVKQVIYHTEHNMLITCSDDLTDGGVWIFNLTTGARTRIFAGGTPDIWTNDVVQIQLSPDQTMLAVGTLTGGVTIFDVIDSNPANWGASYTKSLRIAVGNLPPITGGVMDSDAIYKLLWADNDRLYWSYAAYTGYQHIGHFYTISTDTLTQLFGAYSFNISNASFIIVDDYIYASNNDLIEKISLAGVPVSSVNPGHDFTRLVYDDINNEIVGLGLDAAGLARFSTNLVKLAEYTTPVTEGVYGSSAQSVVEIPGTGIFFYTHYRQLEWYSFHSRQLAGLRTGYLYTALGENTATVLNQGNLITTSNGNRWIAMPGTIGSYPYIIFLPLDKIGRIRYGVFEYNDISKELITTGVDFYDVGNPVHLSDLNYLQFPKFCRDEDDRLYFYFNRWNPDITSGNELAPVFGIIEPDTKKLSILGRIRRGYTKTIETRSRVRNTILLDNLQIRARLSRMRCIQMQARIVPTIIQTISIKSAILGWKSTTIPASFYIQKIVTNNVRATFWTNTGNTRTMTMECQSRIIKTSRTKATGHFFVPVVNQVQTFTVQGRYLQTINIRSRIGSL